MDLNTSDYGGFVDQASQMLRQKLQLPQGYTYQWSGEYEFQLRAKERMKIILPVVFFVIFLLLYMIFHNLTEAMVLIFPTFYAMTGGLILQWLLATTSALRCGLGHRPVWHCCGDRRDGRVSARIARQANCFRSPAH